MAFKRSAVRSRLSPPYRTGPFHGGMGRFSSVFNDLCHDSAGRGGIIRAGTGRAESYSRHQKSHYAIYCDKEIMSIGKKQGRGGGDPFQSTTTKAGTHSGHPLHFLPIDKSLSLFAGYQLLIPVFIARFRPAPGQIRETPTELIRRGSMSTARQKRADG